MSETVTGRRQFVSMAEFRNGATLASVSSSSPCGLRRARCKWSTRQPVRHSRSGPTVVWCRLYETIPNTRRQRRRAFAPSPTTNRPGGEGGTLVVWVSVWASGSTLFDASSHTKKGVPRGPGTPFQILRWADSLSGRRSWLAAAVARSRRRCATLLYCTRCRERSGLRSLWSPSLPRP